MRKDLESWLRGETQFPAGRADAPKSVPAESLNLPVLSLNTEPPAQEAELPIAVMEQPVAEELNLPRLSMEPAEQAGEVPPVVKIPESWQPEEEPSPAEPDGHVDLPVEIPSDSWQPETVEPVQQSEAEDPPVPHDTEPPAAAQEHTGAATEAAYLEELIRQRTMHNDEKNFEPADEGQDDKADPPATQDTVTPDDVLCGPPPSAVDDGEGEEQGGITAKEQLQYTYREQNNDEEYTEEDFNKLAYEQQEHEAARFAEQLRRVEQMRRTATNVKRAGFRSSNGRIIGLLLLIFLIAAIIYATYSHLKNYSFDALQGKADELYAQERYDEAVLMYEDTAQHYPKRAEPLLGIARSSERLGRVQGAVDAYQSLLEILPGDAVQNRSGVYCEQGRLHTLVKSWEDARKCFDEAVALDPTSYTAYFSLGGVLEELKRPADALTAYKRALDLSPSSDAAKQAVERLSVNVPSVTSGDEANTYARSVQMGSVSLGLKNFREASENFAAALAIRSDDAAVWLGFADARQGLGDRNGAVKSYQKVLELDANNAEAKLKLSAIEEESGQSSKKQPSTKKKPAPKKPAARSRKKRSSLPVDQYRNGLLSELGIPLAGVNRSLSRAALFDIGVRGYQSGDYHGAFDAFSACLASRQKDVLPLESLAGEVGPLWPAFSADLGLAPDLLLLSEAVKLNSADRALYLNLSLAGSSMGLSRPSVKTVMTHIYRHAAAQR